MSATNTTNPFADADIVHRYTRAEAIRDGVLVDVSETGREAGFSIPTTVTAAVFNQSVRWTEDDVKKEAEHLPGRSRTPLERRVDGRLQGPPARLSREQEFHCAVPAARRPPPRPRPPATADAQARNRSRRRRRAGRHDPPARRGLRSSGNHSDRDR